MVKWCKIRRGKEAKLATLFDLDKMKQSQMLLSQIK
jgi:hypothetical protein